MQLPEITGISVFRGADITKFIKVYKSYSSYTRTNLVAKDIVATFPFYCSEMHQVIIKMMNSYLKTGPKVLKEEQKDDFNHGNSQVLFFNILYP